MPYKKYITENNAVDFSNISLLLYQIFLLLFLIFMFELLLKSLFINVQITLFYYLSYVHFVKIQK